MEVERLLTVDDVQAIFSMGRTKAYILMRTKGFPAIRLNNRLYVQRKTLEAWMKSQEGKKFAY